jgi:hypothetical protein
MGPDPKVLLKVRRWDRDRLDRIRKLRRLELLECALGREAGCLVEFVL